METSSLYQKLSKNLIDSEPVLANQVLNTKSSAVPLDSNTAGPEPRFHLHTFYAVSPCFLFDFWDEGISQAPYLRQSLSSAAESSGHSGLPFC